MADLPQAQRIQIGDDQWLAPEPAAAWLAMEREAQQKWGINLRARDGGRICGSPGDYNRGIWSQWYAWEAYTQHGGNLAAKPCTSNHIGGRAVDCYDRITRWVVDQIGAKYGWRHGEAPGEWWHVTYYGGFEGVIGPDIKWVQQRLQKWVPHYGVIDDGEIGPVTTRAIKDFQRIHGLRPDGEVGAATEKALRQTDPLVPEERFAVNRYLLSRYHKKPQSERRAHWKRIADLRKKLYQYMQERGENANRKARWRILAGYTD